MKRMLAVCFLSLPAVGFAAPCSVSLKVPASWQRVTNASLLTYRLPGGAGDLTAECSTVQHEMSDVEFLEHIGTEEAEEAPALEKFGPYRGVIWSMDQDRKEMQWWLIKGRRIVHFIARENKAGVSEQLEHEITRVVGTATIGEAQPGAPANAPRPAGSGRG